MAIEWVKLFVGAFDGASFKRIKRIEKTNTSTRNLLTAVWTELITLAGKCNCGGLFLSSEENEPMSIETISLLIDREEDEVEWCLRYYIDNKMMGCDNGVYFLKNWYKYQNEDQLEKIKKQTRERVAKHREVKKNAVESSVSEEKMTNVTLHTVTCNGVTKCNAIEKNKNENKDKENKSNDLFIEGEEEKENVSGFFLPPCPHEEIIDLFNSICRSSPPVVEISKDKVTALDRLWSSISEPNIEVFRACFEKVAKTPFLCGKNGRGWKVTFGWIVNPDNFQKVMFGKYDSFNNHKKSFSVSDIDEMIKEMEENGEDKSCQDDADVDVIVSTARDIQEQR